MITGMVGLPGAGKTLHVVGEVILPALKEGRLVVTNINLNVRELRVQVGEFIDNLLVIIRDDHDAETPVLAFSEVEHFTKYDGWRKDGDSGEGPLFVVDECHAPFADCVGLSANKHPIVQWMAKHRHKGCDVYLLTQEIIGIPSAIRKRVEVIYKFVRKGFLGLNKSFWRHTYDTNGNKLPGSIEGKYNPDWYRLYQSYAGGAKEDRTRVPTIWSDWRFKFIVVGLALTVCFAIYFFSTSRFFNDKPPATAQKATMPSPGVPGVETAQAVRVPEPIASHQAEIAEINGKIDLLHAKRRLERVQAGCEEPEPGVPASGSGIIGNLVAAPASSGATDKCGSARPLRYMHDQVAVRIIGAVLVNAQWVYWLEMSRGPYRWREKGHDLEPFGFVVLPVNECLAWLKGERGNYRITCDGPNIIGYEDPVPMEVVTHQVRPSVEHSGDIIDLEKSSAPAAAKVSQ
jgi:zona occludens toxin